MQGSGFSWHSDELAVLHHKSDEPVSMCMLDSKNQHWNRVPEETAQEDALPYLIAQEIC